MEGCVATFLVFFLFFPLVFFERGVSLSFLYVIYGRENLFSKDHIGHKGIAEGSKSTSGLWRKVFVKALPNISDGISVRHNICIYNAQYYDLSARRNLWCEILEFWACSDNILTLCRLHYQEEKCAINTELNKPHRVAIAPLLHSNSATFIIQ